MRLPPIEPTEPELRAAYESRRRSHWPDFESSMADPIYSRLIRIQALHGEIERHSGTRYAAPPAYVVTELVRQNPPDSAGQHFTPRRKDDGPHWWDSI